MRRLLVVLALGLAVCMFVAALPAHSVQKADKKNQAWVVKGQKLYKQYCASCHGVDGKGDGPAAAALKVAPADLTAIQQPGEKFPFESVRVSIDGERAVTAHGTREMPVWGTVLRRARGDLAQADIESLTRYVESIQKAGS